MNDIEVNIQKKNIRIEWIDNAKALGIMLVIIGHCYDCWAVHWLYTFHMPLFFFLSGITLSTSSTFTVFAKKKVTSIIVPYICYAFIRLFYLTIRDTISKGWKTSSLMLIKRFIGCFVSLRNTDYSIGLWFLPLLFLCLMYLWMLSRIENVIIQGCIVLITIGIGFLYARKVCHPLIWGIDASFIAGPFCWLGYILKKNLSKFNIIWKYGLLFGIATIIISYFSEKLYMRNGVIPCYPDMYYGRYIVYPVYIVGSVVGILFIISLSKFLERRKNAAFSFIGRNTIHIYCIHQIIIEILSIIIKKTIGNDFSTNHWLAFFMNMFITFLILIICTVYIQVLKFLKKYISRKLS